jgi:hypothetical protein
MSTPHTTRVGPAITPAACAAGGLVLAAVVIGAGNYHVAKGESGGTGPAIVTGILCVVLAAVLFGLVVPRTRGSVRTTLVLGTLSLLSLPAFWSGITPVLAAATFAAADGRAQLGKKAAVGQALAAGAALLALGWTLANSHLF